MASSSGVRCPLFPVASRAWMSSTEAVKSSINSGRSLKPMTKNSSSGLAVLMNCRMDSRARISFEVMEPERSKMIPMETGASSLAKVLIFCSPLLSKTLKSSFSSPVTRRFMGSVTVIGTSTMSTFMRMSAPGRALRAPGPVAAGASTPAGAPAAGAVEVDGGGTCTLLSGSSWACAYAKRQTAANACRHAVRSTRCGTTHRSTLKRRLERFLIPRHRNEFDRDGSTASRGRTGRSDAEFDPVVLQHPGQRRCWDTIVPGTCLGSLARNTRLAGAILTLSIWSTTFRMAHIYPFRAWHYNPATVRLDDVVTQPYDKISPAMQQAYYQRSPYNLVRIILGLPELFDAERGESVYTRAARDLRAWQQQGVLTQEKDPCVFAYSQRFKVPGTEIVKERRGFIALGKLHEYAERVVFRHEQTLSKPKSDRLNLLKATLAHFGQIFMLYSDPAGSVEKILYEGNGLADAEITYEYR